MRWKEVGQRDLRGNRREARQMVLYIEDAMYGLQTPLPLSQMHHGLLVLKKTTSA